MLWHKKVLLRTMAYNQQDHMERFWSNSIFKYLRVEPEDHYFLLTEPVCLPGQRHQCGSLSLHMTLRPVCARLAPLSNIYSP